MSDAIEAIISLRGGHEVRGYFTDSDAYIAFIAHVDVEDKNMYCVSHTGAVHVRPSDVVLLRRSGPRKPR